MGFGGFRLSGWLRFHADGGAPFGPPKLSRKTRVKPAGTDGTGPAFAVAAEDGCAPDGEVERSGPEFVTASAITARKQAVIATAAPVTHVILGRARKAVRQRFMARPYCHGS